MPDRPICVLIGALGGQGGGVLADWLVEAARLARYPAQSTSIPGVAQRTGATTYYFELYPESRPEADPVFCLFPSAGDVDLMVALEPTEAGRALERGYITDRTTVVTAVTRMYSTAEKSVAGDGRLASAAILEALTSAARRVIRLGPDNPFGTQLNAAAFGALIGSGLLPLTADQARAAIDARGLAPKANRQGFEAGLALAGGQVPVQFTVGADMTAEPGLLSPFRGPPREHGGRWAGGEVAFAPAPAGWEAERAALPASLRPLVGHALARLEEYQDRAYARLYLERLRPVMEADLLEPGQAQRLTTEVARRLAAWMSYEDVIRVAQLKTRPGRLARLRREIGARPHEPVEVVDFLSPSRTEVLSLLPESKTELRELSAPVRYRSGLKFPWPTSTPWGFAALRLLAALRPLRPRTAGFAREQRLIQGWLEAVRQTARVDYALACDVAALAVWARGYGEVRARGLTRITTVLADWPARLADDPGAARQQVREALHAARYAPDD